ncbi:hypothetical protein [Garciella nitratireducens]|uniref:hypothetical protein n=1 Tax=Garciella nitratireducens TaxID=218205 RepID=UPI001FA93CF8|nr:hypothetical protein [Garciella nitratireducens]
MMVSFLSRSRSQVKQSTLLSSAELWKKLSINIIKAKFPQAKGRVESSAFSYKGKYYQLVKDGKKVPAMPKAKLIVLSSPKMGVKAFYGGVVYDTLLLEDRPKKQTVEQPELEKSIIQ